MLNLFVNKHRSIIEWLFVGVVFGLLTVPVWLKVDYLPIRLWDESQNAINAFEMEETHNWLVRTENYVPDTFDCKPPLLIWFQVVAIKTFGANELAIRLPSVIFALAALSLLFALVYKMTDKKWTALIAVLITVTSESFYGEHAVRFGEHEPLLILLILGFLFFLYRFSVSTYIKDIYLMGLFIVLGVLAKSIAILMILPGALVYLAYCKRLKYLFQTKHLYIATLLSIGTIGTYYAARTYLYQPDYLYHVWHGELFPRFTNSSETHHFRYISFWFYFELMYKEKFILWSLIALLAISVPLLIRKCSREWMFWMIGSSSFLLILSAGTKHYWYIAPAIPMIAGLIAASVSMLMDKHRTTGLLAVVVIFVCGVFTYEKAYSYALHPQEKWDEWERYGITYFLNDSTHQSNLSANTKILLRPYNAHEAYRFYLKKLEKEKGLIIDRTTFEELQVGDTILSHHKMVIDSLRKDYRVEVLDSSWQYTKLSVLHEHKQVLQ